MPRGGARVGTPGTQYPNRTDLAQPVQTTTAQQYGDRQAAMERQQAVPLPKRVGEQIAGQAQPAGAPPAGPGGGAPPEMGGIPPGLGYHDPTERPHEPVTAGLSTGPGPGPSPGTGWTDPDMIAIRTLYQAHPTEDLRRLIERWGA